ncbi:hypothetical protein BKA62DRAFT_755789 [Auriculariales sp. MPI-PUGE-AT-0066]|nr:hypothetical protein BKA62DRAFT_755789 [Auriculariales sp. MPI-PUGE-AT-0066]
MSEHKVAHLAHITSRDEEEQQQQPGQYLRQHQIIHEPFSPRHNALTSRYYLPESIPSTVIAYTGLPSAHNKYLSNVRISPAGSSSTDFLAPPNNILPVHGGFAATPIGGGLSPALHPQLRPHTIDCGVYTPALNRAEYPPCSSYNDAQADHQAEGGQLWDRHHDGRSQLKYQANEAEYVCYLPTCGMRYRCEHDLFLHLREGHRGHEAPARMFEGSAVRSNPENTPRFTSTNTLQLHNLTSTPTRSAASLIDSVETAAVPSSDSWRTTLAYVFILVTFILSASAVLKRI